MWIIESLEVAELLLFLVQEWFFERVHWKKKYPSQPPLECWNSNLSWNRLLFHTIESLEQNHKKNNRFLARFAHQNSNQTNLK